MIVVGLMSGTSMDGIDVAAADLALDGDVLRLCPLASETVPYSDALRRALADALPPAATTLEAVCRLDTGVGQEFAAAAEGMCARVGADLVVSHGQTVFHWTGDGAVQGTLQIGQPAWIAERTGRPVVSDLRAADVAAGGCGAPLVSLFDVLLLGRDRRRGALNLGGIANLTVAGPGTDPVAYDIGPANALIDAATRRVTGGAAALDAGGGRAARGKVDEPLLEVLLDDPYYRRAPPKTTGKEHFNAAYLDTALARGGAVDDDDLVATVTAHAAGVVAADCRRWDLSEVVASGGGTANDTLMALLAERLGPTRLTGIDSMGLPSPAKEAYAFAVLGFLSVCGLGGTVPSCTGARHPAVLGRLTPPGGAGLAVPAGAVAPSRLVVGA